MRRLNSKLSGSIVLFEASVSFFGLILAILFAVYPQVSQGEFVWRKPLIGSAFAVVCILGILAVLFPNACSGFFAAGRQEKGSHLRISRGAASVLRGHHPQCSGYSVHVFTVGRRVFCATCSGLFLGALFVLPGVCMFFFGNWQIGQNAVLAVVVGVVGVALGLLQSSVPVLQNSVVRLFAGVFFVVGAFLILLGIEELNRNVSLDFFIVVLSIFWLVTRISFSQWDHERICSRCASQSCSLRSNC